MPCVLELSPLLKKLKNKGTDKARRTGTTSMVSSWSKRKQRGDKKLKLLDFCISKERQQKLERAAVSTLTIPCSLEEPPETPGLRQPQLVLFSVLCSLAKAEVILPRQGSSRISPQGWHSSCKVTGEKLAWLHPSNGSRF